VRATGRTDAGRTRWTSRRTRPLAGGMCAAAVAVTGACGADPGSAEGSIAQDFELSSPQGTVRLTVGSKNFTEQEILGAITSQALQAAGAEVVDETDLGDTEDVRRALVSGRIDMYWEYTGTAWLVHLAEPDAIADPEELATSVSEEDLQRNGIAWLTPAPANNTYAIAVAKGAGEELGVRRISDLQRLIEERPEQATLCVGPEFGSRADGLPGLEQHYGFSFPDRSVFEVSPTTVYGAVDKGETCTFGSVFRTNGRIPELGLELLEDDEDFFAAYNPALTMREGTLETYPEMSELFGPIAAELDTSTLRQLSASVEVEGNAPAVVAERWLRERGFTG
jgi:osmoprotectant transport system substrate-binding protein